MVFMPLVSRGQTIGVAAAVSIDGRPFTTADLPLFGEVARRASLSIDNARLYLESQQAVRAREEVLAIVSHDLRNPLSSIRLAASLVREQVGGTRAVGLVERIDRSADQMNRLLGDLLDAARIEAGGLVGEPKPERLSPIVDEACELFAIEASRRSISVGRRVPPVTVLCERDLVIRVLANLLGNALKFTPPGGSISVFAEERDHEVEVRVSDTGCGMSAEDLEHVFDRYWQRYHSDRRGSGLGLYIARGIVEAHGGRIWVESELGVGTTFHFTLKRAHAADAPTAEQRA
jgi:signal transduction histidine kinase